MPDDRIEGEPNIYQANSEEERSQFQDVLRKEYEEQKFSQYPPELSELIISTELPKPPFLERFVSLANERVTKLCQDFGVEARPIPLKNIHIIPKETMTAINEHDKVPKFAHGAAKYDPTHQAILTRIPRLEGQENDYENSYAALYFLRMVTHEMMHMYSYRSYDVIYQLGNTGKAERALYDHRSGIHLQHRGTSVFHYMNEGLTDQIAEMVFMDIMSDEGLLDSMEACGFSRANVQSLLAKEDSIDYRLRGRHGPYFKHKEALEYLYQEMSQANPQKYPSKDDVFRHFTSAYFGGRIVDLFREIKKTFGKKGLEIAEKENPFEVESKLRRRRFLERLVDSIKRFVK